MPYFGASYISTAYNMGKAKCREIKQYIYRIRNFVMSFFFVDLFSGTPTVITLCHCNEGDADSLAYARDEI